MPMRSGVRIALVLLLMVSADARAQQRPLVTEDPETIGAGRVLVEAGLDYGRDVLYPASGLNGSLLRLPLVGVSVGIGSIADIQLDSGWNRLAIAERRPAPLSGAVTATGNRSSGVEDMVVATKVRLAPEGTRRPALGLRFATKLPNASNENGLGLGTTDFLAFALVAKTMQSVRIVGNLGMGLLGDPTRGGGRNDVILYGVSFARALTEAAEVVGELNGRADRGQGQPPPGTESHSLLRFGGRYTRGLVRVDGGLVVGLASRDPGLGFSAGVTYVFNAFRIP